MDLAVLFMGFATLAGLIAGYVLTRFGRGWMVLAAWTLTGLAIIGYAMWLDTGTEPLGRSTISVLYIGLIPFGLALVMGSVLGMIMRVIFGRAGAE